MDANELAERLRQRKEEIGAANDWLRNKGVRGISTSGKPSVRITQSHILINSNACHALAWNKGQKIALAYSPSQMVIRLFPAEDGEGASYTLGKNGMLCARTALREFGIKPPMSFDLASRRLRDAILIGGDLFIEVSDLVETPPAP